MKVEVDPRNPSVVVPIGEGSIFGEVGLISGRRRGATIRAAEPLIVVEIDRTAALKLMASIKAARDTVNRISIERQILQIFGSGLSAGDITEVLASAQVIEVKPDEPIIREGEDGYDIYIIRSGSMIVEKEIGGKAVFLSYVPAGTYSGEMALIDGGRRTATVRAAIKSEVVRLNGDVFRELLARKPQLETKMRADMKARREVNSFIEKQKDSFGGVVDMYSAVAEFLVDQGIGEATDVLLIDEKLCIGCDNCEKACADIHDGLSRLDREAGRSYAHLHVPTSCRHCERPYCMTDCPPNAIHRGRDGGVFIDESCIGCGNCQRNCPYEVIRMDKAPAEKPGLLGWLFFGVGPGPGEPSKKWRKKHTDPAIEAPKKAIKCDMCAGLSRTACVAHARRVLQSASHLKHFSLSPNWNEIPDGYARNAPGRRRARKFPAPSQLALAQGRPCDFRSGNSRLCIDPCSPRALWRNLVWLYTRNSRRGADRLVDPARFAQAHHDPGALVAQGMDLSTCLAWPLPDYRGHTPYRHETRLEPRHTGLDPDDGGHHLRHRRRDRLCRTARSDRSC